MFLDLLHKWGYLGVFIGSLIEGESVVLTISSMCYFGKFYLPKVMLLAFLGTWIADQISFFIGRTIGSRMLAKSTKLVTKSTKILGLLEKYDVPFILGFRFIYGIRIISPFFIGLSHISTMKFFLLNLVSAIVWSVLSCTLGYYIGAFSKVIGKEHGYITIVFNVLITLMIMFGVHLLSKKLTKKHEASQNKKI